MMTPRPTGASSCANNDTVTNMSQMIQCGCPQNVASLARIPTNKATTLHCVMNAMEDKAAPVPHKYMLGDFSEEGNSFTAH